MTSKPNLKTKPRDREPCPTCGVDLRYYGGHPIPHDRGWCLLVDIVGDESRVEWRPEDGEYLVDMSAVADVEAWKRFYSSFLVVEEELLSRKVVRLLDVPPERTPVAIEAWLDA